MDDLARWRDEFPILSRSVYMISNSLGAMPRQTARNLAEYAETWATRGVRGWEERWWEMPSEIGNKIARIIGAPRGTVSMHENVTTAQMVALSCVRPSATRKRIVCSAMDFPSMIYLYRAQQAAGFELRVVPAEDDLTVSTERMLEAIDESTAVVAFSHVLFRTLVHHGRRRHRPPRARGRRDHDPRHLSVGRHHPGRRRRARRRLRGRRLPEMAVWRAGQRVPLHAPGSARGRAAVVHRLAVAQRIRSIRHRSDDLPRRHRLRPMRCT